MEVKPVFQLRENMVVIKTRYHVGLNKNKNVFEEEEAMSRKKKTDESS